MIELIGQSTLKEVFDSVSKESLIDLSKSNDEQLRLYLTNFVIFEKFSDKLLNYSPITKFYNKYYWFQKYVNRNHKLNGFDAGLEQQSFKLLDEAEHIKGIDWQVIKEISEL